MPLGINFDWSEDEHMLYFVLHVRGVKSKNVDVEICDVFVKVNCHPSLFEVDLLKEIDPDDPKTRCRVGAGKVTLNLRKKSPGLWHDFRATGSKAELVERRKAALAEAAKREDERIQKKDDWKQSMLRAGESDQWQLDQRNREKIEQWEQEEKARWEEEVYASFDEHTDKAKTQAQLPVEKGDLDDLDAPDMPELPSSEHDTKNDARNQKSKSLNTPVPKVCEVTDEEAEQIRASNEAPPPLIAPDSKNASIWSKEDLDGTEEYIPDVRENPGKVGIRFSVRPRPGVPVRDRGQIREPPHPKTVKSDLPPMLEGDRQEDESDPVWLKDKADNLMAAGDYQGAHNAYTEALKLASNARAFANRAVASMYLGNLESCIEDCGHTLRLLDLKNKAPAGSMPGAADPEDQYVRCCAEARMATAYLWLGAFGKSEQHFNKAIEAADDGGLERPDRKIVREDLERVQAVRAALALKEKADAAIRRASGGGEQERTALNTALEMYDEATNAAEESVGARANRCFARLRAGNLEECKADAEVVLEGLKQWPAAMRPPEKPPRPTRLDPPYLDDPTFKHPDEQKQGEVDWLMKHNGGGTRDLPSLPPEYEWIKDANEKADDAWIAVRKKMTKSAIDTVKRNTMTLQDAVYTRNPRVIREQLPVSLDTNKVGEGPSDKAIRQAELYAEQLEKHEQEKQAEREEAETRRALEIDECDLEKALAPSRAGVAQHGFGRNHPIEKTRRRIYVKTRLRRAKAFELLGDAEAGVEELRAVLRVEPDNPEAKKRLAILACPPAPEPEVEVSKPSVQPDPSASPWRKTAKAEEQHRSSGSTATASTPGAGTSSKEADTGKSTLSDAAAKKKGRSREIIDDDDEEDEGIDHASTAGLLASAAEYMKKNDYNSALQIYNYARKKSRDRWETPLLELKVLSNTCLCLQRCRGRLPELVAACNEVMERIEYYRDQGGDALPEETLLHMESACLSRRGSALAQLQRTDESSRDAARVRELTQRAKDLQAGAGGGR
eukprot:TRINITY_DN46165_c0_g1_i1.p1 TRINITY_DN46165_c0_g1~~TRINITY_DN46165_c0_g1_i1.p1  ORF type:complete len:1012 (-),score=210.23 TRINITY_DN46165_c0_g1_i1:168-3203(-)